VRVVSDEKKKKKNKPEECKYCNGTGNASGKIQANPHDWSPCGMCAGTGLNLYGQILPEPTTPA